VLSKRKFIIAGALVTVLLVAGIGGTMALAQSPTPQTASGAKTLVDLFWQALAQKLGTTVDKVKQAETDARKDAITQGVTAGLLTQTQADSMLQRLQNGTLDGPFGGRGPNGGPFDGASAAVASAARDAAAKALGISSADLTTALQTKSLLTLAQEKNVDVTTLRTAIANAEKAALDQAVKDGTLSQAQADALKANIKPENIDLTHGLPGASPRGGPGGPNRPGGLGGPGKH
jgi:uncharacterized protein YidB (DUF937 family)